MARPLRDGIDYFPFDVGMLRDPKVKLIKGEFGIMGVYVLLTVLSLTYEENGYFKEWSDDVCILVADEVGCGCNFGTVAEIVKGCVRRSLFNERVLDAFGVLTSAGIQRRYVRAASQRDEIQVLQEYWLLDIDSRKDVPVGVRNKITFKSISTNGNPVKTSDNPGKTSDNPQRKAKESKAKKSKAKDTGDRKRKASGALTVEQQKRFEAFWAIWPNKKSPGQAETTFAKIDPDDELMKEILAGVERAMKYDHRFRETRYMPHPSTWLNARGWQDEFVASKGSYTFGNERDYSYEELEDVFTAL